MKTQNMLSGTGISMPDKGGDIIAQPCWPIRRKKKKVGNAAASSRLTAMIHQGRVCVEYSSIKNKHHEPAPQDNRCDRFNSETSLFINHRRK